jgi:hypothetical protein
VAGNLSSLQKNLTLKEKQLKLKQIEAEALKLSMEIEE